MGTVSTVVGGGTPSTQDSSHFGGEVPWLTPADLSGYGSKYISSGETGERSLTQTGFERSSAKMVPAGSILFTSRAPVGYVAIAEAPVCTNQGFKNFVLEPDEELAAIDEAVAEIGATMKKADTLRRSILHRAFTGNLLPQYPTDEPASELLKRIAGEREARQRRRGQGHRRTRLSARKAG